MSEVYSTGFENSAPRLGEFFPPGAFKMRPENPEENNRHENAAESHEENTGDAGNTDQTEFEAQNEEKSDEIDEVVTRQYSYDALERIAYLTMGMRKILTHLEMRSNSGEPDPLYVDFKFDSDEQQNELWEEILGRLREIDAPVSNSAPFFLKYFRPFSAEDRSVLDSNSLPSFDSLPLLNQMEIRIFVAMVMAMSVYTKNPEESNTENGDSGA